jgi:hypothetical protein
MNCSAAEALAWIEDRLLPEPNSGCFLWTGSVGSHGYGDFRWGARARTVPRFVLEQMLGRALAPGELVLHKCDMRLCARREHLTVGTAQANSRDMMAKGRQRFEGLKLMQTPGVPHRKEVP